MHSEVLPVSSHFFRFEQITEMSKFSKHFMLEPRGENVLQGQIDIIRRSIPPPPPHDQIKRFRSAYDSASV